MMSLLQNQNIYIIRYMMLLLVTLAGIALFTGCSNTEVAGSATETTNGKITGVTHDPDNEPTSGVKVELYPEDYDPLGRVARPVTWSTETDDEGQYLLDGVVRGTYNIEMQDPVNGFRQLVRNVEITEDHEKNSETVDLGTAKLQLPSSMTIYLNEIDGTEQEYLYIPGTSIYQVLDSADIADGSVTFKDIPSSVYTDVNYTGADDPSQENLLTRELAVKPDENISLGPYDMWSDTLVVTVNTSPSGANMPDNLYGYPILIRLEPGDAAAERIFANSQSGGSDLRFSKTDGTTPLAYEIEEWDGGGKSALIWVRLDTVLGHSSTQSFKLYTDNPGATQKSGPEEVFNLHNNFGLAYHLNESPGLDTYGVTTGNMNASNLTEGNIGMGITFKANQRILPPSPTPGILHDATTQFTLSSWVRLDSSQGKYQIIMEIGGIDNGMVIGYDTHNNKMVFITMVNSGKVEIVSASDFLQDHPDFIHITGVYKDGDMSLYINGTFEADSTNGSKIPTHPDGPGIGNNGDFDNATGVSGTYWSGVMDELRYSTAARSKDWIRMDYESQKKGSNTVTIE